MVIYEPSKFEVGQNLHTIVVHLPADQPDPSTFNQNLIKCVDAAVKFGIKEIAIVLVLQTINRSIFKRCTANGEVTVYICGSVDAPEPDKDALDLLYRHSRLESNVIKLNDWGYGTKTKSQHARLLKQGKWMDRAYYETTGKNSPADNRFPFAKNNAFWQAHCSRLKFSGLVCGQGGCGRAALHVTGGDNIYYVDENSTVSYLPLTSQDPTTDLAIYGEDLPNGEIDPNKICFIYFAHNKTKLPVWVSNSNLRTKGPNGVDMKVRLMMPLRRIGPQEYVAAKASLIPGMSGAPIYQQHIDNTGRKTIQLKCVYLGKTGRADLAKNYAMPYVVSDTKMSCNSKEYYERAAQEIFDGVVGKVYSVDGETGTGKSTSFVVSITKKCIETGEPKHLVLTTPKREPSARTAERIRQLMEDYKEHLTINHLIGTQAPAPIGYVPKWGSGRVTLTICTNGYYNAHSNAFKRVDYVLVDEYHERDNVEVVLTTLRLMQQPARKKVAFLTATPPSWPLAQKVNANLNWKPQTPFPIVERNLTTGSKMPVNDYWIKYANIYYSWPAGTDGVTLIFLPTKNAVTQAVNDLTKQGLTAHKFTSEHRLDLNLLGLHDVVCATNIAESSLTIPHCSLVIDLCLVMKVDYDIRVDTSGVTSYVWEEVTRVVQANNNNKSQRRGRTGRVCQGNIITQL